MKTLGHFGMLCVTGLAGTFMVGCASDSRPRDVPAAALYKTDGDQKLVYTAADPGTVWVTEGSNNILYSTNVRSGDRVELDPAIGKLMLNGQVVLDKDVNHTDHKIFFLPGAAPASSAEAVAASDRSLRRPEGVPMTALVGGEGKDRVEYTVPRDGFVWITDVDQQRVLSAAPANRGDIVVVDPQKNLMTINGQPISKQDVSNNNHRIFFSSERAVRTPTAAADVSTGSMNRPADVPLDAVSRAEGADRIDFVATRDGTVWVADMTSGRTVYTGRILTNDHLSLDPGANRLTLNGQSVRTPELAHDRYAIYFSVR